MAEPRPGPRGPPSAPSASQLPPPSAPSASQLPPPSAPSAFSQLPPPSAPSASQLPPPSAPSASQLHPPSAPGASQLAPPSASQLPPLSAPSASQCSQLPPPNLGGLVPPSHFVLRPRSLGAELEAERGRGQILEAELEALRGRSLALGAELEALRGRGRALEAELEAERGRSLALEAELEAERGRSLALEAELEAERGRSLALEAELEAEKGRGQVLQEELEALRGRGLGTEGAEPSPEQVLLRRWRQKVLELLLRLSLSRAEEQRLRGQAVSRERRRAEAAEEALGELGRALSRLWGSQAELSAALGALGTLSERLERAGHRVTALVASGRLRWQREPEGTAGDSGAAAPEARWHRGGTGGGSVPVSPPRCPLEATKGRDGTGAAAGTGSLGPWLVQLQALGAAILGDGGATVGPPRPAAARGALSPMSPMSPMSPPPRGRPQPGPGLATVTSSGTAVMSSETLTTSRGRR